MKDLTLGYRVLRHALLLLLASAFLAPFVRMFLTSLKPASEIFSRDVMLFPQQLALVENYGRALTAVPLLQYLLNGVYVCLGILLMQIVLVVPAAYAFAKLRFRFKELGWRIVLLAMMVPYQAVAIPLYVMFYHLGILDTRFSLILPFVASAFGIFLIRQFFKTVPDDLIHAARLDGMGELELVWRVMLPTAIPAITAFSILSVVAHWNDYFWPLLMISSPELATPPLGTILFRNEEAGTDYGPLMAGTVLITAPLLVLFALAQKRFIDSVTYSGVKG